MVSGAADEWCLTHLRSDRDCEASRNGLRLLASVVLITGVGAKRTGRDRAGQAGDVALAAARLFGARNRCWVEVRSAPLDRMLGQGCPQPEEKCEAGRDEHDAPVAMHEDQQIAEHGLRTVMRGVGSARASSQEGRAERFALSLQAVLATAGCGLEKGSVTVSRSVDRTGWTIGPGRASPLCARPGSRLVVHKFAARGRADDRRIIQS